ncbi:hypothetical protein JTE90_010632 [Oedothorax gibbosus]|nr:hypothetical protein JTE90_010632 [Oedothorax gibbosus]
MSLLDNLLENIKHEKEGLMLLKLLEIQERTVNSNYSDNFGNKTSKNRAVSADEVQRRPYMEYLLSLLTKEEENQKKFKAPLKSSAFSELESNISKEIQQKPTSFLDSEFNNDEKLTVLKVEDSFQNKSILDMLLDQEKKLVMNEGSSEDLVETNTIYEEKQIKKYTDKRSRTTPSDLNKSLTAHHEFTTRAEKLKSKIFEFEKAEIVKSVTNKAETSPFFEETTSSEDFSNPLQNNVYGKNLKENSSYTTGNTTNIYDKYTNGYLSSTSTDEMKLLFPILTIDLDYSTEKSRNAEYESAFLSTIDKQKTTFKDSPQENETNNKNLKEIVFNRMVNARKVYESIKKVYQSNATNNTFIEQLTPFSATTTSKFDNSTQNPSTKGENDSAILPIFEDQTKSIESFIDVPPEFDSNKEKLKEIIFNRINTRNIYESNEIEYQLNTTNNSIIKLFTSFPRTSKFDNLTQNPSTNLENESAILPTFDEHTPTFKTFKFFPPEKGANSEKLKEIIFNRMNTRKIYESYEIEDQSNTTNNSEIKRFTFSNTTTNKFVSSTQKPSTIAENESEILPTFGEQTKTIETFIDLPPEHNANSENLKEILFNRMNTRKIYESNENKYQPYTIHNNIIKPFNSFPTAKNFDNSTQKSSTKAERESAIHEQTTTFETFIDFPPEKITNSEKLKEVIFNRMNARKIYESNKIRFKPNSTPIELQSNNSETELFTSFTNTTTSNFDNSTQRPSAKTENESSILQTFEEQPKTLETFIDLKPKYDATSESLKEIIYNRMNLRKVYENNEIGYQSNTTNNSELQLFTYFPNTTTSKFDNSTQKPATKAEKHSDILPTSDEQMTTFANFIDSPPRQGSSRENLKEIIFNKMHTRTVYESNEIGYQSNSTNNSIIERLTSLPDIRTTKFDNATQKPSTNAENKSEILPIFDEQMTTIKTFMDISPEKGTNIEKLKEIIFNRMNTRKIYESNENIFDSNTINNSIIEWFTSSPDVTTSNSTVANNVLETLQNITDKTRHFDYSKDTSEENKLHRKTTNKSSANNMMLETSKVYNGINYIKQSNTKNTVAVKFLSNSLTFGTSDFADKYSESTNDKSSFLQTADEKLNKFQPLKDFIRKISTQSESLEENNSNVVTNTKVNEDYINEYRFSSSVNDEALESTSMMSNITAINFTPGHRNSIVNKPAISYTTTKEKVTMTDTSTDFIHQNGTPTKNVKATISNGNINATEVLESYTNVYQFNTTINGALELSSPMSNVTEMRFNDTEEKQKLHSRAESEVSQFSNKQISFDTSIDSLQEITIPDKILTENITKNIMQTDEIYIHDNRSGSGRTTTSATDSYLSLQNITTIEGNDSAKSPNLENVLLKTQTIKNLQNYTLGSSKSLFTAPNINLLRSITPLYLPKVAQRNTNGTYHENSTPIPNFSFINISKTFKNIDDENAISNTYTNNLPQMTTSSYLSNVERRTTESIYHGTSTTFLNFNHNNISKVFDGEKVISKTSSINSPKKTTTLNWSNIVEGIFKRINHKTSSPIPNFNDINAGKTFEVLKNKKFVPIITNMNSPQMTPLPYLSNITRRNTKSTQNNTTTPFPNFNFINVNKAFENIDGEEAISNNINIDSPQMKTPPYMSNIAGLFAESINHKTSSLFPNSNRNDVSKTFRNTEDEKVISNNTNINSSRMTTPPYMPNFGRNFKSINHETSSLFPNLNHKRISKILKNTEDEEVSQTTTSINLPHKITQPYLPNIVPRNTKSTNLETLTSFPYFYRINISKNFENFDVEKYIQYFESMNHKTSMPRNFSQLSASKILEDFNTENHVPVIGSINSPQTTTAMYLSNVAQRIPENRNRATITPSPNFNFSNLNKTFDNIDETIIPFTSDMILPQMTTASYFSNIERRISNSINHKTSTPPNFNHMNASHIFEDINSEKVVPVIGSINSPQMKILSYLSDIPRRFSEKINNKTSTPPNFNSMIASKTFQGFNNEKVVPVIGSINSPPMINVAQRFPENTNHVTFTPSTNFNIINLNKNIVGEKIITITSQINLPLTTTAQYARKFSENINQKSSTPPNFQYLNTRKTFEDFNNKNVVVHSINSLQMTTPSYVSNVAQIVSENTYHETLSTFSNYDFLHENKTIENIDDEETIPIATRLYSPTMTTPPSSLNVEKRNHEIADQNFSTQLPDLNIISVAKTLRNIIDDALHQNVKPFLNSNDKQILKSDLKDIHNTQEHSFEAGEEVVKTYIPAIMRRKMFQLRPSKATEVFKAINNTTTEPMPTDKLSILDYLKNSPYSLLQNKFTTKIPSTRRLHNLNKENEIIGIGSKESKPASAKNGTFSQIQQAVAFQNLKSTTAIPVKKNLFEDTMYEEQTKVHLRKRPALYDYLYPPLLGGKEDDASYFMDEDMKSRLARNIDEDTINLMDSDEQNQDSYFIDDMKSKSARNIDEDIMSQMNYDKHNQTSDHLNSFTSSINDSDKSVNLEFKKSTQFPEENNLEASLESKKKSFTGIVSKDHLPAPAKTTKISPQNNYPFYFRNQKSTTVIPVSKKLKDLIPGVGMKINERLHPALYDYLIPPLLGGMEDVSYFLDDMRSRSARNIDRYKSNLRNPDELKEPSTNESHDQMYLNKLVLAIK